MTCLIALVGVKWSCLRINKQAFPPVWQQRGRQVVLRMLKRASTMVRDPFNLRPGVNQIENVFYSVSRGPWSHLLLFRRTPVSEWSRGILDLVHFEGPILWFRGMLKRASTLVRDLISLIRFKKLAPPQNRRLMVYYH